MRRLTSNHVALLLLLIKYIYKYKERRSFTLAVHRVADGLWPNA